MSVWETQNSLVKLPGKGISPVLSNHNVVQVPITNSQKVGGNAVPHQAAHLVQLSSVNPILFHMPFLQGNLFRGFYMTMGTSSPVKVWFHIISQQLLLFKRKMHLAFGCIWHINDLTMTWFCHTFAWHGCWWSLHAVTCHRWSFPSEVLRVWPSRTSTKLIISWRDRTSTWVVTDSQMSPYLFAFTHYFECIFLRFSWCCCCCCSIAPFHQFFVIAFSVSVWSRPHGPSNAWN